MAVNEKITIDESDVIKSLDAVINKFDEAEKKSDEWEKALKKDFSDAGKSASSMGAATNKLVGDLDKVVKKEEDLKKSTLSVKDALKGAADQTTIFGVNLGQTAEKINGGIAGIKNWTNGLKGASGAMKALQLAGGPLLLALTALVAYFTKTQKGIDQARVALAAFTSVVDNVVDRIAKFGGGLVELFKGNPTQAFNDMKEAVSGLGDELRKDAEAAIELERRSQALRDSQIELTKEYAKAKKEIKEYNLIAEDTARSYSEREEAAKKAFTLEQGFLEKNKELAIENAEIIAKRNELSESLTADKEAEAEAIARVSELEEASLERQTTLNNKLNGIRKEASAAAQQAAAAEAKKVEELTKAYEDLTAQIEDKVQAARLDSLSGAARLEAERDLALKSIDLLEDTAVKSAELAKRSDEEINKIHSDFIELRKAVDEEYSNSVFELNREIAENTKKTFEAASESFLPATEIARDFKKELGDALKPEEVFSDFEQSLIDDFGPKLGRELIKSMGQGAEVAASSDDVFDRLKGKILDTLGIDESEAGAIIDSLNLVKDAILGNIDAQLSENEKLLASIREQTSTVEDELKKQEYLQAEGFASNVSLNKMRLQELEKEEKKALEEQKKLQKQKAAIETVEQVSSLITASANIFKSFSALGPFGVPLSIAAIATMFGTFIATKARANASTRAYKGGALSDYLGNRNSDFVQRGGPSDTYGRGDGIPIGDTGVVVSGDEFLVAEGPAGEHTAHLRALNKGKYRGMNIEAMLKGMPDHGAIVGRFGKRQAQIDEMNASSMRAMYYQAVRDGVAGSINKQTDDLIGYLKAQPKYAPLTDQGYMKWDDKTVEIVKKMKD